MNEVPHERLVRPWFLRLMDALPGGPWRAGALIAATLIPIEILLTWVLGSPAVLHGGPWINGIILGGAVAYSLVGAAVVNRDSAGDLRDLRGSLHGSPQEFDDHVHRLRHMPRLSLLVSTAVALPVTWLLGANRMPWRGPALGESVGVAEVWWFVQAGVSMTVIFPVLYAGYWTLRHFARIGRHQVRIDLLDLDALAPFARFGLRLSLWLLGASIFLVLMAAFVETDPLRASARIPLFVPVWVLAVGALVVPSWGLHQAIRDAKAEEIERLREALRGNRNALDGSPVAHEAANLSIVELLEYRDRITALREWPFDARALRRFGLYLLIPLASWVGAALVERLVDRVLGG